MGPEILLTTLLPALVPAFADGIRGLIARFTGSEGAKPQSVAEVIQLMTAEVERIKAVAMLDSGGETYKWVEAVRKLQRPVVAGFVLVAWVWACGFGNGDAYAQDVTTQMAQIVFSYLFGERAYLYSKKATAK
ncbi:MAG: hypothetical protein NUW01_18490 [Gemmatimonadaceae bacterium]|nr:hypothetical protein [Gemmatimonadaceae bacterium]